MFYSQCHIEYSQISLKCEQAVSTENAYRSSDLLNDTLPTYWSKLIHVPNIQGRIAYFTYFRSRCNCFKQ